MAQTNRTGRWIAAALVAAMMAASPGALAAPGPGEPGARPAPGTDSPAWKESQKLREEGLTLAREGKLAEAQGRLERALALREKARGKSHIDVAGLVYDLGLLALGAKDLKRAEPFFLRAIAIVEKSLGRDHVNLADPLHSLSETYAAQKDYPRAIPVAEREVAVLEKALGKDHEQVIGAVSSLEALFEESRDFKRAIPLAGRVLAHLEKTLGPTDVRITGRLHELAQMLRATGDLARAIPTGERVVAILEGAHGPDHIDVAGALYTVAMMHLEARSLDRAVAAMERVAAICEKKREPGHADIEASLDTLASMYEQMGDYRRAVARKERVLAMREEALGKADPRVADALNHLAILHAEAVDYTRAVALLRRSLSIREKALGPKDPLIATTLANLGELHLRKGELVQAEPLFQRALAIFEEAKGRDSLEVGVTYNNLASLYLERGDSRQALDLYTRALAIREKALGPDHSDVAAALGNIAEVHMRTLDYASAKPLLERAVAVREKALGGGHPLVARSIMNLASVHLGLGERDRAEAMLERALALQEKSLGKDHLDVAVALNNIAAVRQERGDFKGAQALLERALRIREAALGPDHPSLAVTLDNLAAQHVAQGSMAKAVELAARGSAISERHLALMIAAGSQEQKLAYLDTLQGLTDSTVSLHMQSAPRDPAAADLALTTILRRKGRVLDAMADSMSALRRRLAPEDQALLDKLASVRGELAQTIFVQFEDGEAQRKHRATIERLEQESGRLEAAISARSGEFRALAAPVTKEKIQAALPAGAALVEIFAYHPWSPAAAPGKRFGDARYAAFVLRGSGPVSSVDLGRAASIDAQVSALRRALSDPARADAKDLGRALDEQVMRPIRALLALLGGATSILISPDSALNLVPFAALRDEDGRFLIERASFTYLTSGRDLLRLSARSASRQPAAIIANPSFDVGTTEGPAPAAGTERASLLGKASFPPLPGTAGEAKALGSMLEGAAVMTEARATKAALSKLHGPAILHVATHGFFLPSELVRARSGGRGLELEPGARPTPPRSHAESPLLLSGLALAGANALGDAKAQGVMTALEVMGLDLHGTKLVVLSACETGLGEVRAGEGVYGLRRALVMAGAETQVMSLWKVDDEATRDLMVAYYKQLQAGGGRGSSMRDVQRAMLASEASSHPFYWASFIVSGDPSSLDGERGAGVPRVSPGARGCGCEVAGGAPEGTDRAAWLGLAAALGAARALRRRRPRRRRSDVS